MTLSRTTASDVKAYRVIDKRMTENPRINRPVLRYHGGKWRLAPWIISHFPKHRIYVEPYGGAASILMRKPRSYAEVYNDLDGEIVNVFRVLRDPNLSWELRNLLKLTPFSRAEFELAYEATDEPVEQARRTVIKAFMGFGSNAIHKSKPSGMRTRASTWKTPTGFRSNSNRSGTIPAHDWMHFPDSIKQFCERLSGVVIENRNAFDVIATHDRCDTLHYADPPYVMSTRADDKNDYSFEMTDDDHVELAVVLRNIKGMAIISGYDSELYRELYSDWHKVTKSTLVDKTLPRIECLWISPNAELQQGRLSF